MSGENKITANIVNGGIGGNPANNRGRSAMVVTATTVSGLALNTPKVINSLAEAVALGLTAAATPFAYRQIKGYYDAYAFLTGSEKAPLHLMTVADTVTLANMADKDYANGLKKLLDDPTSENKPRLAGIARDPDVGYTPDLTDGVEADSLTALANAQALANVLKGENRPARVLVEMRGLLYANIDDLEDLATHSENRVMPVIGSQLADGSADVGIMLGLLSAGNISENPGNVENGNLNFITQAYVGDKKIEEFIARDTLSDKGYVYFRTYMNRNGYFVNDDRMATALTDDYVWMNRGRLVDEIQRISDSVLTGKVGSKYETEPSTGVLTEGARLNIEAAMRNQVEIELSQDIPKREDGTYLYVKVDPDHNVVTSGKTKLTERVRPYNHHKDIEFDLGVEL